MSVIRLLLLVILILPSQMAWAGQGDSLVLINGKHYSQQDFGHWWQYWRDEKSIFPERPDKFINWQLQVQEAERMELGTMPVVKHKLDVFLKARALMRLKYDEIDSKIDITDADISASYERDYSPSRLVAVLDFKNKKRALAAREEFNTKRPGLDEIKALASIENPDFKLQHPQWLRPKTIPRNWYEKLVNSSAGDFVGPLVVGDKFMLLYLVDIKPGSKEDLAHKRAAIRANIFNKKQRRLTENLLKSLKKIYNVKINTDLLAEIDLSAPKKENWDKILVTSTLSQVTVGYFIEQCRKEQKMGSQKSPARYQQRQATLKHRAMSAMVSNSLVDWAAADRHYEQKEPLKWEYQFYRQGQLVKLLQKRIIGDGGQVLANEAKAYYNENQSEFRSADIVKVSLIHGPEGEINRLWASAMASGVLPTTVTRSGVKIDINASSVPVEHLSKTVRSVIEQLTQNDISSPFSDGKQVALVQLFDRQAGSLAPFESVKGSIITKLSKEKTDNLRRAYLMKLRKRSSIKVNDFLWQVIRRGYLKEVLEK